MMLFDPSEVVDESTYPMAPHMRREEARLQTFSSWPSTAPVRPRDLAEAGLYYLGERDRVQCFCCGGMLGGWETGDTAWGEHTKHFSNCFFILGHDVGNVPFQGMTEEGSSQQQGNNHVPMGSFEERLGSFAGVHHPIDHERLATAGFYSTGRRDKVLCFCCGGGLKGWQPEEEPWVEHAKHYPGCRFLLAEKGQEFVNSIQLQDPRQNRDTLHSKKEGRRKRCHKRGMASQGNGERDSGPEASVPSGQDPPPPSSQALAGGKRAKKRRWTERSSLFDPRVDLMQRQLEDVRKTIECMAANQQRLFNLPQQIPPCGPPHPDAVSLAASDNLDRTNSSGCGSSGQAEVYAEDDDVGADSQGGGDCPRSCYFSVEALLSRAAAAAAGLPPPCSPPRASALDRDPRSQRQAPLPVYKEFVQLLQRSWAHPREATAPRSALSLLSQAAEHGLDGVSKVGPTFALLAGAPTTGSRVARHPNSKCRTTDGLVLKAFQSVAMASRLANTNALLLVYLEGLIRDLESKSPDNLLPEMERVVDTVIQGASSQARVLGNSLAQLTMARRHIWLSQSGLADADRDAVLEAAIAPGEVFGPAAEAALDEAQKIHGCQGQPPPHPAASERECLHQHPGLPRQHATPPGMR